MIPVPELLLELFSEEIPARMQARAAEDLTRLVTAGLKEAGLEHGEVRGLVTPRRLTLVVDGLPEKQPDLREEKRGPKVDAPDKEPPQRPVGGQAAYISGAAAACAAAGALPGGKAAVIDISQHERLIALAFVFLENTRKRRCNRSIALHFARAIHERRTAKQWPTLRVIVH